MADFLETMAKKALGAGLSAAGGKLGGAAASLVLDLVGLGDNDAAAVQQALDEIKDKLAEVDTEIDKLTTEVKWEHKVDGFDALTTAIATHIDNITTHLKNPDKTERDAAIVEYLKTANPPISGLDANLRLLHERIVGKGDDMTESATDSLMAAYIAHDWASIWKADPAATYDGLMGLFRRGANVQRNGISLLAAYYRHVDQHQGDLADKLPATLAARLAQQYGIGVRAMPHLIAMLALPHRKLSVGATRFTTAADDLYLMEPPEMKTSLNVSSMDVVRFLNIGGGTTMLHPHGTTKQPLGCGLDRVPGSQGLVLSGEASFHFATSGVSFLTPLQAVKADVLTDRIGGGWGTMPSDTYAPVTVVVLANRAGLGPPIEVGVEATDKPDVYRLTHADGRVFADVDRNMSAHLLELVASGGSTGTPLTFAIDGGERTPGEASHRLSAWSRAFADTPAGEGRFKPGFRVRYRVVGRNRFGEGAKSGWIKADGSNQDGDGYFDGNGTYYFPQIALCQDVRYRTEAYRVYRQFEGEAEEDVTDHGTFTGDPQTDDEVIFDDFKP